MSFYKIDFLVCAAVIVLATVFITLIGGDGEDAAGKGMGEGFVFIGAFIVVLIGALSAVVHWLFWN